MMIMGTHGHLLSLRMQSFVGDVNLLGIFMDSTFAGFNHCWIQVLLDSTYGRGFRGDSSNGSICFKNCCWHYIAI